MIIQRKRSQGADVSARGSPGVRQTLTIANGDERGEGDNVEPTHATTDLVRTVQLG